MSKKILLGIILAILVFSLFHSFYFKIRPSVDARAYDKIAVNLISGRGYTEDLNVPKEKDFSIVRVGPGYELFLAGVYKIFGHHYGAVWFLQAIFLALSALLVFLISKQIFEDNWNFVIGLSALILVGFSPDLLIMASMLLTEILGIFLMLLSVYFFFRYYESRDRLNFFLFTVFFVFSVFVRSQMAVFSVIFLALFIFRKEWKKMVLFVLFVLLLFSPWVIRNYLIYDAFIPFNASLGYNLWGGNHMGASGEMELNYQPLIDFAKEHTPVETHQRGIEEFKKFIFQHPIEFSKITLKRVSIFFSFSRPTGFWPAFSAKQQAGTAFFSLIYSVIVFTLGISGILLFFSSKRNRISFGEKRRVLFFLAFVALIPASVMFILVETRYRFALYPFLAVFGGLAVSEIIRAKKIKFLIWPAVILFANSVLDFVLNFGKFWSKLENII